MSKREKLIVIITIITVIGAGFYLYFPFDSETIPEKKEDLAGWLKNTISESLEPKENSKLKTDSYIFSRASEEWTKDPFFQFELVESTDDKTDRKELSETISHFIYSGYLEMNNKKLAIINGFEYEVGDQMENAGYYVKSITPAQALIGVKGKKFTITVPLEEIK